MTFREKRAVFRMGKRAMMRFGKRAMMRFGKRSVFRLGWVIDSAVQHCTETDFRAKLTSTQLPVFQRFVYSSPRLLEVSFLLHPIAKKVCVFLDVWNNKVNMCYASFVLFHILLFGGNFFSPCPEFCLLQKERVKATSNHVTSRGNLFNVTPQVSHGSREIRCIAKSY